MELNEKKLINDVLNDIDVKTFIDTYKINTNLFDAYINIFMAYYIKKNKCNGCKGIDNCLQSRRGLVPVLDYEDGIISLDYDKCVYLKKLESEKLTHLHLYNTSFVNVNEDLYTNEERKNVLNFCKKYLTSITNTPSQKGLYLYGKYGHGKSYISAWLASKIAKMGIDVAYVYYPDFVRMVKTMIINGNVNKIVDELKKMPILFLDDMGGESNTSFIRDEVLLPILQYRMVNKKPIFITSNLNEEEMINHLANGAKNKDVEYVKALRVFERIRVLTEMMNLQDKNYR